MNRSQTVAPATEPVGLAEAKLHLRVDTSQDDDLIEALIATAREQAEYLTGQRLITQTWELELSAGESVSLWGLVPLQSVSSTISANISVDANWPPTATANLADTVTITCGFGDADDVPRSIRQWMLLRIGALYEQREAVVSGVASLQALPRPVGDALLDPYCLPRC